MPSSGTVVSRKLKLHKKSRQGCGNCKLRKVKCDESKPKCKRCIAYGVFCNYDDRYSDLQLSADGAFKIQILQEFPHPLSQSILNRVAPTLRLQSMGRRESIALYQLTDRDLELLRKFQGRTVFTISTDKNLYVYQKELIKLACSHPYLMHSILTLTLMHDRYLSAVTTPLSTTEAFHWYQSVTLFKNKLSGPVQPSERDPLWATAMCLGIISFFYVDAEMPEEAWPLKPPSATDLNWLKMTDGKKEVWRVAGPPMEPHSLFEKPFPENIKSLLPPSAGPGLEALPSEFIKLYSFDTHSTDEGNPYRAVATSLAQSLHINSILPIIVGFLSFIGNMHPEYKQLLEQKDPRALLLLAYWFAKVCQFQHWWISRRAALEGQAICMYLEKHHRHQPDIKKLLQFPTMVFSNFRG